MNKQCKIQRTTYNTHTQPSTSNTKKIFYYLLLDCLLLILKKYMFVVCILNDTDTGSKILALAQSIIILFVDLFFSWRDNCRFAFPGFTFAFKLQTCPHIHFFKLSSENTFTGSSITLVFWLIGIHLEIFNI